MNPLVKAIGAVVVSIALLAAGLWVLLNEQGSADLQKVAAGWVGAVAGYWLK